MPVAVCAGATCMCSMGLSPGTFVATPRTVFFGGPIQGNIGDSKIINLPTFGMCNSPTNPAVISATSAASGVHTPAPCVPSLSPWAPGAINVLVDNMPALNNSSTALCANGGSVSITVPGQLPVLV